MGSLQDAIGRVCSEKATERSLGLTAYREIFQNAANRERLGRGAEGDKKWLRVLQALFNCVVMERSACLRKGSYDQAAPTTKKRLQDGAGTVLWLVERACNYIGSQTLTSALNHITSMIVFRTELFQPIAAVYLKALRILLSFKPHVQHIDEEMWTHCTTICFNVILNRGISEEISYEQACKDAQDRHSVLSAGRSSLNGTPRRTRSEDVEAGRCIQALVQSEYAPLLRPSHAGSTALIQIASVLSDFPQETSLHLPMVHAARCLTDTLLLNRPECALAFAKLTWSRLLALWSTRGQALKEHTTLLHRSLTPLLIRDGQIELLEKLYDTIRAEADDHISAYPLRLDVIELRGNFQVCPFQYACMRIGMLANEADIRAWSMLENAADIAVELELHRSDSNDPALGSTKRRKLGDGSTASAVGGCLAPLYENISAKGKPPTERLWALQILLFVVLRSFQRLSQPQQLELMRQLLDMPGDKVTIQAWTFVTLSACAVYETFKSVAGHAWHLASRQVIQNPASRASCSLLAAILRRRLLPRADYRGSLSSLIEALQGNGIVNLCDSLAILLMETVRFARQDIELAQSGFEQTLLGCLSRWGSTLDLNVPPSPALLRSEDLANLLLAISTGTCHEIIAPPLSVRRCETATWVVQYNQNGAINRYVLSGVLDDMEGDSKGGVNIPKTRPRSLETQVRPPNSHQVRCFGLLSQAMRLAAAHVETVKADSRPLRESVTLFSIQLGLASSYMLAVLHDTGVSLDIPLLEQSFELFRMCIDACSTSATVISVKKLALELLAVCLHPESMTFEPRWDLQHVDGRSSGNLVDRASTIPVSHSLSMQALWQDNAALAVTAAIRGVLDDCIAQSSIDGGDVSGAVDDSWTQTRTFEDDEALRDLSVACLSILCPLLMSQDSGDSASSFNKLAISISGKNSLVFLALGKCFLMDGDIPLSIEVQEAWLDCFGSDILASYELERSVDGHLLVIAFLKARSRMWTQVDRSSVDQEGHYAQLCDFFVQQDKLGNLDYRVRIDLAELLLGIAKEEGRLSNKLRDICRLCAGPDVRAQFHAAASMGRIFRSLDQSSSEAAVDLYVELQELLPKTAGNRTEMAMRILILGNICVASTQVRSRALYHVLETCVADDAMRMCGRSVITKVAEVLLFADPTQIWRTFASEILQALIMNGLPLDSIPFEIFGFESQRVWAQVSAREGAPALLDVGDDIHLSAFRTLCGMAGRSVRTTVSENMSAIAAHMLVSTRSYKTVVRRISDLLDNTGATDEVNITLQGQLDELLVEFLQYWYEPTSQGAVSYVNKCTSTSSEGQSGAVIAILTMNKVSCDTPGICEILDDALAACPKVDRTALAFNVIHQLAKFTYEAGLGNPGKSHFWALQIYCAFEWPSIKRSPLLQRLVLQMATSLIALDQKVLTVILPILTAVLQLPGLAIPGYMALIVRLEGQTHACAAMWSPSSAVLALLSGFIRRAFEDEELRADAIGALCAWSQPVPTDIAELLGSFRLRDFQTSLSKIGEMNVALLTRCREYLQEASDAEKTSFSSGVLWMILDKIRALKGLLRDTVEISVVMADILYLCSGRITTPRVKALQTPSDKLHLSAAVRKIASDSKTPTLPIRNWIMLRLLHLTRSQNLSEAQDALRSIRLMHTKDATFAGRSANWEDGDLNEYQLVTSLRSEVILRVQKRFREDLTGPLATEMVKDYDKWTAWLCVLLCEILTMRDADRPYLHLAGFLKAQAKGAAIFLPAVMHLIYRMRIGKNQESIKDAAVLSEHLIAALKDDQADERIWLSIISLVLQLREDTPSNAPFSSETWIDNLDFLLLARRADHVRLYASALLFLELRHQHGPPLSAGEQQIYTTLLYSIYDKTGEPDSFYGVKNDDVNDALLRTLHHEYRWRDVFELEAARHEATNTRQPTAAVADALHRQGFDRLALQIGPVDVPDYEAAWKARRWDLPIAENEDRSRPMDLYSALRSLHENRDRNHSREILGNSFTRAFTDLAFINVEAKQEAVEVFNDLLCLREIRQWSEGRRDMYANGVGAEFEFGLYNRLLCVQLSLLQSSVNRLKTSVNQEIDMEALEAALSCEGVVLLELSKRARAEGEIQIAANAVVQAQRRMASVHDAARRQVVEEEFANVLWAQGRHAIAISSLERSAEKVLGPTDLHAKLRKAVALTRLADWRATARSHRPEHIVSECYEPAQKLFSEIGANAEMAETAYRFGSFADDQYRLLNGSTEAKELRKVVNLRREEIKQLHEELKKQSSTSSSSRSLEQARKKAEQIFDLDLATLDEHDKVKDSFRRTAVENFGKQLIMAEEMNTDSLMRMTALWFENAHSERFNESLLKLLKRIPTWKFLPLARQLCSRITRDAQVVDDSSSERSSDSFQKGVSEIVLRIAMEHPFHSLTSLYALARGGHDSDKPKLRALGVRSGSQNTLQSIRSKMAEEIIGLATGRSRHADRIMQLQHLSDACVEWAQYDLVTALSKEFGDKRSSTKSSAPVRIPLHLRITKIRNFDVPVLTLSLPIDRTGTYADFISVSRYADHFTTAGGVHLPKISGCIGSDGKVYRQLFKDRDDLRQDAAMQQVFALVNELLKQDRRANKRQLYVRTYAVIPLGPRYGLLEYVGNTVPLLSPLVSLYERYGKKEDYTPLQAREAISKLHGKTAEEKRRGFEAVCAKIPAVLRFYFLERYTVPMALLQARLNYTRSVATSSIVGHVLGLGDRHSSNILLDQQTGELIHIDFGVAFDQGRLLPIPELVPFRLTRNVVDGMGLNGIEGVFRCGCQETLRILRVNANMIKTVLEVFRYDPLYDWTLNPIKVIRAQGYDAAVTALGTEDGMNGWHERDRARLGQAPNPLLRPGGQGREVAELQAVRAINSVMDKLSDRLSVEYTVNDLMIRAMDPTNLGSIFHGWQAAL